MTPTPEQQARIDRFKAIVQFASKETGVVPIAVLNTVNLRLPDGTPRTEITASVDYAALVNWQPPDAPAETLSANVDSDNPD